jgi:hypothetical protein
VGAGENNEHRTPNIQHRTPNGELRAKLRCSVFDVGCSVFPGAGGKKVFAFQQEEL